MKELWLFTRKFPEGPGETFLENAMPVWAEHFDRVVVVPMFRGVGEAALPPGVVVERPWENAFKPLSKRRTLRQGAEVARLMRAHGGQSPMPERFSHARQLLHKADMLQRILMPRYDPARVTMLCAWMEDWVNVLGIVKRRDTRVRFATLAHGSDLYAERRTGGIIPYRAQQMQQVDRVLCISAHGARYLGEHYPEHEGKVMLTHLGTLDRGVAVWSPGDVLRLVSCAYLRPPKRVHLIAEALRQVVRPVHWTHFGDGPGRGAIESLLRDLPSHVSVELKGGVDQSALMEWYRQTPVDLFVHLSGHEGVPLALMEAASFGIPLLANDVGGVGEVLRPAAGVLLPADITATGLASRLDGGTLDRWLDPDVRAGVRAHWQEHFAAQRNFQRMVEALP